MSKRMKHQFTGREDKNGDKIYEGDILKYKRKGKDMTAVVVWSDHHASFMAKNSENFSLAGLLFTAKVEKEKEQQ